jgi:hypothetical protein
MDLFLMSCRWTLSSQQFRQPVKQGQPYALTQVRSGSHQGKRSGSAGSTDVL